VECRGPCAPQVLTYSMIQFVWTPAKFFLYFTFMYETLLYFTYFGMASVRRTTPGRPTCSPDVSGRAPEESAARLTLCSDRRTGPGPGAGFLRVSKGFQGNCSPGRWPSAPPWTWPPCSAATSTPPPTCLRARPRAPARLPRCHGLVADSGLLARASHRTACMPPRSPTTACPAECQAQCVH